MYKFLLVLIPLFLLSCNDDRKIDMEKRTAAQEGLNPQRSETQERKEEWIPLMRINLEGIEYPEFIKKKELYLKIQNCSMSKISRSISCYQSEIITFTLDDTSSNIYFTTHNNQINGAYNSICIEEMNSTCSTYEISGFIEHEDIADRDYFRYLITKKKEFEYSYHKAGVDKIYEGMIWEKISPSLFGGDNKQLYFLTTEVDNFNLMYFRSHSRLAADEDDYGASVVFTLAAPKKFNDDVELPNVPLGGFYDVVLTNRFILENGEANLSFGTGDITQTDVQLEFKLKTDFEVSE